MNVYRLDPKTRKKTMKYCAYPTGAMPTEDKVAAQKLMLMTNEDGFLKIANAWAC
jgi:hypothetical protein